MLEAECPGRKAQVTDNPKWVDKIPDIKRYFLQSSFML